VAGTRILESRIVEVEASPWGTFLTAVLTLGLTALLAAYAPARRATRVDPVEA
jgi:ABC-type lipoprotein release transport system permease subunit